MRVDVSDTRRTWYRFNMQVFAAALDRYPCRLTGPDGLAD
jgi:hypothetical protein